MKVQSGALNRLREHGRTGPIGRRWKMVAGVGGVVSLALFSGTGIALAGEGDLLCFPEDTPSPHFDKDHGGYTDTLWQADSTWDETVWTGPTYQCPTEVPSCMYAWNESKTTSWSWSISVIIGGQNNPTTQMFQAIPNYGRSGSTTTSFTWTITMLPGQYAAPIQVVRRRQESGEFVGAWLHNSTYDYQCRSTGRSAAGLMFEWKGGHRWGDWKQDTRVEDFATYKIWR